MPNPGNYKRELVLPFTLLDASRRKFDVQYVIKLSFTLPPRQSIFGISWKGGSNLSSTCHIRLTHGGIQHIAHLLYVILPPDISCMSGPSHIQGTSILAMPRI